MVLIDIPRDQMLTLFQTFPPFSFCILLVVTNWPVGRPGNKNCQKRSGRVGQIGRECGGKMGREIDEVEERDRCLPYRV